MTAQQREDLIKAIREDALYGYMHDTQYTLPMEDYAEVAKEIAWWIAEAEDWPMLKERLIQDVSKFEVDG